MTKKVIIMATAQFTYTVGLVSDVGSPIHKPTFKNARQLLKEFLSAHDGEFLGHFKQDGKEYRDQALAKMSKDTENILQEVNWHLHLTGNSRPFVERLEGPIFDISLAEEVTIYECNWDTKIQLGIPVAFGTA